MIFSSSPDVKKKKKNQDKRSPAATKAMVRMISAFLINCLVSKTIDQEDS